MNRGRSRTFTFSYGKRKEAGNERGEKEGGEREIEGRKERETRGRERERGKKEREGGREGEEGKRETERECACYFLRPLSYPDPFQVHCNVSLIYVAPRLHLLTMSGL